METINEKTNEVINEATTEDKTTNIIRQDIIVVGDKSGSMASIGDTPLAALNVLITEQKELNIRENLEGNISLYLFNERVETVYEEEPLKNASPFERFGASGGTALYDAIDKIIRRKLKSTHNKNVIMVIFTDGEENASKRCDKLLIKALIYYVEKEYNWKIIYIGANQNVDDVSNDIGISAAYDYDYTEDGFMNMVRGVSAGLTQMRSGESAEIPRLQLRRSDYVNTLTPAGDTDNILSMSTVPIMSRTTTSFDMDTK